MKKLLKTVLSVIMVCVIFFAMATIASAEEDISVILDGNKLTFADQNPLIVEDRTLVPFRGILEAMGVTVEWDGSTRTVTAVRDAVTVKLTIDDPVMYKNEEAITLDVPAQIINSRTMVPARAVSESFGADVSWNPVVRNVVISTDEVLNKALGALNAAKKISWVGSVDFTYSGIPVAVTSSIALDYENKIEAVGYTIDMASNKTAMTVVTGIGTTYTEEDGQITQKATPADWEPATFLDAGSAFVLKEEAEGLRTYGLVHGGADAIQLELSVDVQTGQIQSMIIPKEELGAYLALPAADYTKDLTGEVVFDSDEALNLWNRYNK